MPQISPRRRSRVWQHPAAIEAEYVRAARGFAREIGRETKRVVLPALGEVAALAVHRTDAAGDDAEFAAAAAGTYLAPLEQAVTRLAGAVDRHARALWGVAKRLAGDTQRFNARQFRLTVRSALGVDVFKSEPWLLPEIKAWEAENLRLIKSIPEQHAAKLRGTVSQALREGQSTADIRRAVMDLTGVTEDRAELIARDQIGKLNASLTKLRQTGIGVKEFRWRGVLDQRERMSHRALEGRVCSWDSPPEGGPGVPILCRCWAEAVFPELAGIDGLIQP